MTHIRLNSMRLALSTAALAPCLLVPPIPARAMEVSGPAVIVNGDTLWVGSQEVRIHGIDAPETSQKCQLPKGTWDCASAAIDALANMIEGKAVRCVGNEIDQCGRLIAKCSTIGFPDIGARLVATGLAWAFVRYSTEYSGLEIGPRARKVGIWQSKTQPPWEYRARRWATAARIIPSGCPIKGNINAKGEKIYHAPWSKHYAKTRVDLRKAGDGSAVRPKPRRPDGERLIDNNTRRRRPLRCDYQFSQCLFCNAISSARPQHGRQMCRGYIKLRKMP